ncbi:MAG TPA: hypothetical protein VKA86_09945 [Candidatus Krumholzibacteria bacterium]|nr:hypothetical protein [Candidatus Krumholzibacteria bacterium]
MNTLRTMLLPRSVTLLGVVVAGLLLPGCLTEETQVNGSVPITLSADWTTQGFTDSDGTLGGLTNAQIDRIFEDLDDADLQSVRDALEAGQEVQVAGLRAFVTRNEGHVAQRQGVLQIDTGSGFEDAAEVNVPSNEAGTEATAANGRIVIEESFTGLGDLRGVMQDFLSAYLGGNRDAARQILLGLGWSATWSSTPPPTPQDPDDFDWTSEIVVMVPSQYTIDVPNL